MPAVRGLERRRCCSVLAALKGYLPPPPARPRPVPVDAGCTRPLAAPLLQCARGSRRVPSSSCTSPTRPCRRRLYEASSGAVVAVCSRLSKGSFLLLLHVLDPSLSMLNSYASRLNVPLVSSGNAFNSSVAFSINLRPLYHGAIIDIMKHYHWRNTFYVYDTDEGMAPMVGRRQKNELIILFY